MCKIDDKRATSPNLDYFRYFENLIKPNAPETWVLMNQNICKIKHEIKSFLENSNQKILGYGASATGTVLLRYLEIDHLLDAIIDDNPKRQNLFAPKSAQPIIKFTDIDDSIVICLAWRHYNYYKNKLKKTNHIIPLPILRKVFL